MLDHGNPHDAAALFAQVLEQEEDNLRAFGGLIVANLKAGSAETARQLIHTIPAELRKDDHIAAAIAKVEVAEEAAKYEGTSAELAAKLEANPDDHATRFELSTALLAQDDREGAVEQLLEIFKRDREWNDGAAKAQLFKLFDSFGANDPVTLKGRRRLTSMIYT